jgi:hypothetical protein
MKTIKIDTIREELAKEDAEGMSGDMIAEMLLDGFTGYAHYEDTECLDWYIQRGNFLDMLLNSEEPTKIAIILDGKGRPKFEIFQECQDVTFEEIK